MKQSFCSALLLFLFMCSSPAVQLGEKVGPVQLLTLDGTPLSMTNYAERRGTVVLLLSARDSSTRHEITTINKLNSRVRLRGILLVGIFPNSEETSDEVRKFAQSNGLLFPVYREPELKAAQQLGVTATPESCLLNPESVLLYRGTVGTTNNSPLEKAVDALLEGRTVEVRQVQTQGTPMGQPQAKRDFADSSPPACFSSELIFERIPYAPAHHCSTIAEATNGDLLVLWYGGSYESADDQTLFLSRRKKGERTWSRPEVLIRNSAQPPGNAVIFRVGDDRLFIVWARMEASRPLRRGGGWGQTRLLYRTSNDHGITWSKDELFLDGVLEGLRNPPLALTNGGVLLPLGHSFAQTLDSGNTWQRLGNVTGGGQPTLIERSDGTFLTFLRKRPHIMQTESRDRGRSWSPPVAIELKNPDAGICMTRLRGGNIILVYNDSDKARTPLSITRSLDEGKTWESPLALESNPGEYSYPCVIQTRDGKLHITYTFRRYSIKHVEMDEGWLTYLHPPN
jgi:predicted neuraminidase